MMRITMQTVTNKFRQDIRRGRQLCKRKKSYTADINNYLKSYTTDINT